MDDDYELVSREDIHRLKDQLNKSKGSDVDVPELRKSISHLNERLSTLIEIFDTAVEDLREEDKESELVSQKIDPIIARLRDIDEQNKKLAQGMVAINSLVDEKLSELNKLAQSMKQAQEDLKDSVNEVLHEVRSKSIDNTGAQGMPSMSQRSSMPPMDQELGLGGRGESERRAREDGRSSSSFGLGGDLPPLPGSRDKIEPKKKFRLF